MAWKPEIERIQDGMENAVYRNVEEYNNSPDAICKFGTPLIGYADSKDPRFEKFYQEDVCKHPKELFKPGYCAMVYYLPFAEDKVGDYEAFYAAMKLCMKINKDIREALNDYGRLSSLCSSMADWSKTHCRYEWNPKIAAYVAGLGEFGPAGSFHTEAGCSGRVGAVMFDKNFSDGPADMTDEEVQAVFDGFFRDCCFEGAEGVECSDEMIAACPAKAISKAGINRELCQEHCMTINAALPDPELCGKCFRCK